MIKIYTLNPNLLFILTLPFRGDIQELAEVVAG